MAGRNRNNKYRSVFSSLFLSRRCGSFTRFRRSKGAQNSQRSLVHCLFVGPQPLYVRNGEYDMVNVRASSGVMESVRGMESLLSLALGRTLTKV